MNRLVIFNCDYDPCSGGIKVMHYLASLTALAGVPTATTSTCFYNPSLTVVGKCEPDDIAVYPEIVADNPLEARRICRYLLWYPRHAFPKGDCGIVYMAEYLEQWRSAAGLPLPPDELVEVPNIEAAEWCFPEPKDIENVVYTGKQTCQEMPEIKPLDFMPRLDDPHRFRLRYMTLAVLRRSRNLFTMDHYTVLEREAILCGCNVFRVHGKQDFRPHHADPEPRIMRPLRDRPLGEKFYSIIKKFFNL